VFRVPNSDRKSLTSINTNLTSTQHMELKDLGLLWIPAGFIVIFASVAVLFLTI
jgi:hypothetical protein